MPVTIHTPASPLDAYIRCFWYCDDPAPYARMKMLPMPSLHLMVNFGDPFRLYEADHTQPFATCSESWTVGLWNTYHIMEWPLDMQVLNVSFKPGGAYPFLQLPLAELHNHIVSLDALWGNLAAEIRERLSTAPTTSVRFALLEQLLLARPVKHRMDSMSCAMRLPLSLRIGGRCRYANSATRSASARNT